MTHPAELASKAGRKPSVGESKVVPQATPPGKALKRSQFDEISAGRLLAERVTKGPWPPCDTDAEGM